MQNKLTLPVKTNNKKDSLLFFKFYFVFFLSITKRLEKKRTAFWRVFKEIVQILYFIRSSLANKRLISNNDGYPNMSYYTSSSTSQQEGKVKKGGNLSTNKIKNLNPYWITGFCERSSSFTIIPALRSGKKANDSTETWEIRATF